MLQHLALVGVVLTSGAIAAPRPLAERLDHVQRDWSSWTASGWGSWYPSPYTSSANQQSTSQVATTLPTTQPTPTVPVVVTVTSSVPSTASASGSATNPCASVAELAASFTSASPSSTATPTVPAQLAFECLNSIPFNQSAAVALLDAIDPYLTWQSTFEYLKDPPAEVSSSNIPAK